MGDMTLGQAQANTQTAASNALGAGLISQAQYSRMTDGTVSHYDLGDAKDLVNAQSHDADSAGKLDVAQKLYEAISNQLTKQSSFGTAVEDVVDTVKR
jgi:hypothetical protein